MALRSVNELDSATDVTIPIDVRGWDVRTIRDDEKVGSVHDVLVDETGAARYLDIDLGLLKKHVLVPLGQAVVDREDDVVWLQAVASDDLGHIPRYDHDADHLDPDYEHQLTTSYDRLSGSSRYDRPEYGGHLPHEGVTDPAMLGTRQVKLGRLSDLDDYKVAADDDDPRGWDVMDGSGEKIGKVDDLVVDPQVMKARYLDVELDEDVLAEGRRSGRMLVPAGYARLDGSRERVFVDALHPADAASLPLYEKEFDEAYEDRIDRHFAQGASGRSRYEHPRYDADRFFAPRNEGNGLGLSPGRRGRAFGGRLRR